MTTRAQLDQLFASLQARNVTAVQRCGWSMNDGLAELEEHRAPEHTGYCFFHEQDAWRVAAGSKLYLAYGAYKRPGSSAMAVAELVYAAARGCGLDIRWDGNPGARMEVGGLDPAEFQDWQEPSESDEDEEDEEQDEDSGNGSEDAGQGGAQAADSSSAGDEDRLEQQHSSRVVSVPAGSIAQHLVAGLHIAEETEQAADDCLPHH